MASRRRLVLVPAIVLAVTPAALAGSGARDRTMASPRLVRVANVRLPTYATAPRSEPGRLYVVERQGRVRVLERGRLRRQPFMDIARLVGLGGERGLLSIAFHPRYAATRLVYAAYTARDGAVTVAEYRSSGAKVVDSSRRVLARVPHDESPYHNGGQLEFGRDGLLYVSVGDGGYYGREPDPHGNSQNLDALLGKIFALDVAEADPQPRIVAYGLRNPWRFSVDPASGDLLIADVGWNRLEELDRLPANAAAPANFGWSVYEGRSARRSGGPIPELNRAGSLTWPILTYATNVRGNCAIVGGYVYRGTRVPRLRGRYVFGDYCSGRIWSVAIRGGRAVGRRLEPIRVPYLASFGQDARGEVYALGLNGGVFRIVR